MEKEKIGWKQLCFKIFNILHTIIFIIGIITILLLVNFWIQFEFCGLKEDIMKYLDILRTCSL